MQRTATDRAATREIVIVAYPGVQSLDVTGPFEVFASASRLVAPGAAGGGVGGRGVAPYRVQIASADGSQLSSSSGIVLTPHIALREAPRRIDTLIVAGGEGQARAASDRALLDWIRARSATARRTASVCTGAFVLAAAGLLDGRRATTHWASAGRLARMYPAVKVDPDPIFVRDGAIWTSAGVTAGMDLALALVEEDLDRETALTIARHLVLFLRRPGNQSQFSATLEAQEPARDSLREIQRSVLECLDGEHSVEAMAARAHMSPRHFARAFRAESGVTPARYVERVRLEAARRSLEESGQPIAAIAASCGFGSAETMRRAFIRSLGVAPAEYRRRFQSRTTAAA